MQVLTRGGGGGTDFAFTYVGAGMGQRDQWDRWIRFQRAPVFLFPQRGALKDGVTQIRSASLNV